jgi:hypothetical protein
MKGTLGISTVDLFVAAGYIAADDLPGFRAYLFAKHPEWPDIAVQEIEDFYHFMEHKCSHKQC